MCLLTPVILNSVCHTEDPNHHEGAVAALTTSCIMIHMQSSERYCVPDDVHFSIIHIPYDYMDLLYCHHELLPHF